MDRRRAPQLSVSSQWRASRRGSLGAAAGVAALAVIGVASSCASAQGDVAPGTDVCVDSATKASARVSKVADDNAACASDADCFEVPLRTSCFDACSRSVNQTGKGAVDRAETLVEAGECKTFRSAGCKLVAPPCAPPRAPTCKEGRCE